RLAALLHLRIDGRFVTAPPFLRTAPTIGESAMHLSCGNGFSRWPRFRRRSCFRGFHRESGPLRDRAGKHRARKYQSVEYFRPIRAHIPVTERPGKQRLSQPSAVVIEAAKINDGVLVVGGN